MKKLVFALGALVLLSSCDPHDGVTARDGWVRAAPPGAMMTAGYLTIENRYNSNIVLVSITSPDYGSIEIHETLLTNGVAKMRELRSPRISANAAWTLEPGGAHLMLMQPTRDIAPGDEVLITFEFSNGARVPLHLPVRLNEDGAGQ